MNIENLSDNEIRSMEAEVNARRNEVNSAFQHYGSVENMYNTSHLEYQREQQIKQDITYQKYLNNLIENPNVEDFQQFENAVVRSMESNEVMRKFASNMVEEISKATYEFRGIEKTDIMNIEKQKQRLENLVSVYEKYLYILKDKGWDFINNTVGGIIDNDMLEDIWQVQKKFDITFNMPIPKNLGKDYGQAFEREGKMVPAITLMYDDLKGKEVNWYQVINYKENELTPHQRYIQRKEDEVRQFDLARQEEIKNVLAYSHSQNSNLIQNMENQNQVGIQSIRR